jgi:uncharacterized protein (TIGR02246 family)
MSTVPSALSVPATDVAAIQAVLDRQREAWNRHDMDAFVADTTPDVDWINIVGMHWIGRETVRKAHAALHNGMFAHSRLLPAEESTMRQVAPNVVIETHINRIEGATLRPSGAAYPDGGNIMTMVFVKSENGWQIAHAHNTPVDRRAASNDPAKTI